MQGLCTGYECATALLKPCYCPATPLLQPCYSPATALLPQCYSPATALLQLLVHSLILNGGRRTARKRFKFQAQSTGNAAEPDGSPEGNTIS